MHSEEDGEPPPSEKLESLREAIDRVDQQILALLAERIRLVLEVGDYKRERAQPVHDPEREQALLQQLSTEPPWPLESVTVRRVFERLIDESRRIEQAHVSGGKTR